MIWVDHEFVAPERLSIAIADRVFEHGLGLFETFRTWNGKALLFADHLNRIQHSGQKLGIDLDGALPSIEDVDRLVAVNQIPDCLVRLTASAGRPPEVKPIAWMTATPFPAGPHRSNYQVIDAGWTVAIDDPLARHKTLNYWSKRIAFEQAQALGADEAVFTSGDGRIWEGSRTNLFVVLGRQILTPPTSGPIIPGIMRRMVLDAAGSGSASVLEIEIRGDIIDSADEVFLTNSVRGLIPVSGWKGRRYRATNPNFPRTTSLQSLVSSRLTLLSSSP